MASSDNASPSRLARMMSTARMGGRQYIVGFLMAQRAESPAEGTRLAVGIARSIMVTPPPQAPRTAVGLARAIPVGLRSWGFYPPEHPAVAMAVERFISAATDAS